MATEDERNEEVYEEYLRLGGKSSYPRFLEAQFRNELGFFCLWRYKKA